MVLVPVQTEKKGKSNLCAEELTVWTCKSTQRMNTDKKQEYQQSAMDQHSLSQQLRFQMGVAVNEYFKVRFEREQWVYLYRCFSTF